jgi:hypothetical protein
MWAGFDVLVNDLLAFPASVHRGIILSAFVSRASTQRSTLKASGSFRHHSRSAFRGGSLPFWACLGRFLYLLGTNFV